MRSSVFVGAVPRLGLAERMIESRSLSLRLGSSLDSIDAGELIVQGLARDAGHDPDDIGSLGLAVREAMVNAVRHGNQFDEQKSVYFSVEVTPYRITITVRDEGDGFDPEDVPDPTSVENLLKASGRGLLLIRAYVDDVTLRRAEVGGMEMILVKNGPKGDSDKENEE